jgi:hypothetical protein
MIVGPIEVIAIGLAYSALCPKHFLSRDAPCGMSANYYSVEGRSEGVTGATELLFSVPPRPCGLARDVLVAGVTVSPGPKKAIQSLRPAGFTPAFGREVQAFGPAFCGMAEAMPFRSVPQQTVAQFDFAPETV